MISEYLSALRLNTEMSYFSIMWLLYQGIEENPYQSYGWGFIDGREYIARCFRVKRVGVRVYV